MDTVSNKIYSAAKYPNPEIKYANTAAITFLIETIFCECSVKGSTINILITTVAGSQIGAVNKSASPPPIAAAASTYGFGNNAAAR